jgi:hypothetical protein
MTSLFGKPKIPKQTPPEPPPSPIMVDEDRVSRDELTRLRKKKGRASTILNTGPAGSVGLKTALGG